MKKIFAVFGILSVLAMCGNAYAINAITKNFGGTSKIVLKEGERLVNITWKQESMWILTREDPDTKPSVYHFKEHSNFGIMEGTVIIIEK